MLNRRAGDRCLAAPPEQSVSVLPRQAHDGR